MLGFVLELNPSSDWYSCEVWSHPIDTGNSPNYWWENFNEKSDELQAICQRCGDGFKPEDRKVQFVGYQKHY